jgi:hypothetical protein
LFPQLEDASGRPQFLLSPEACVTLGYVPLSREANPVTELMADWSDDELSHALESAREAIRGLVSGAIRFSEKDVPRYADARLTALLGLGQLGTGDEIEE